MIMKIKDLDHDSAVRKMFYEDESGLMQLEVIRKWKPIKPIE